MSGSGRTLKQKVYHEMKELLVITAYLWLVIAALSLHKAVVLHEHYFDAVSHGFAILNALALAKIMLIARDLHLGDMGKDVPLIYPTLLKAAVFSVLLAFFKILEEVAVGRYRGRSFQESIADVGGGTWRGILSLIVIVFVVLIPFFAFDELGALIGEGKLKQVFLHGRQTVKLQEGATEAVDAESERRGAEKKASA